jgi:fermentation-respiration switch protein FrsA (DUF1100 family)
MSIRSFLATAGLLAIPPFGLSYALERAVRQNAFRTGPHVPGAPEAIGVPFEQTRFWTVDGMELEGWFFKQSDVPATILFMHGTNYNASDMWADEDRARLFGGFLRGIGCNFFIFDYRGYGANDGVASEEGTYLDAIGALAHLYDRDDVDPMRIVYYGFSLGTGVATELAVREPGAAALILRAPFTSFRALLLERYPRLQVPLLFAPWLPLTRYDSAAKIRRVRAPLLIMHGDGDETVPFWMGERLFEMANEPKRFVRFTGAAHSDFPLDLMVPAVREMAELAARGGRAAEAASPTTP